MKITLEYDRDAPPEFRWHAYDKDNYEGPVQDYAGDPIGSGSTEREAIQDFIEARHARYCKCDVRDGIVCEWCRS